MADNLTAICDPIVYKMWEPRHLTTLWASTASYRDSFTFFTFLTCMYNTLMSIFAFNIPRQSADSVTHIFYWISYEIKLY
jgi:hypothetical protein